MRLAAVALAAAASVSPALVAGCGASEVTSGRWEGQASDAGAIDAAGLADDYPTSDPNPNGGTHQAPGFGGDGGLPAPGVHCAGKLGEAGDAPGATHTLSITSGGLGRSSLVHLPPGYDATSGAMLVLNFHGFTMNAEREMVVSRMNVASDATGFIVAYPDGIAGSWNAGDCCGDSWTGGVDDVDFVRDLLAKLEADYCIDPSRVYATGFSNGGFLAYRLACEMAGTFAAIAPVSGVEGTAPESCHPSRAVPVLHFHGTSDPVVHYNGGAPLLPFNFPSPITFRSVAETMSIWRGKDGCLNPARAIFANGDASCTTWGSCNSAGEVTLCTIDGGGHTWPGGVPMTGFLGKTSNDISATDSIVRFFLAHPMR